MCWYGLSNVLIKDELLLFCFSLFKIWVVFAITAYPRHSGTYLCFVFDKVCLQGRPYLWNYSEATWYVCSRQAVLPNSSSSTLHGLCILTVPPFISSSIYSCRPFPKELSSFTCSFLPGQDASPFCIFLPQKCCPHWFSWFSATTALMRGVILFNI